MLKTNKAMKEVRLERMLPQDIRQCMDETNLLYIPIAGLEWHGPHLPYGTDALNAYTVALKAAQEFGGLVHPIVYAGTEVPRSPELVSAFGLTPDTKVVGMDMPGFCLKSFYMPPDALKSVVEAVVNTAITVGFKRIVLVNGHCAVDQIRVLQEIAREMNNDRVKVIYFVVTDVGDKIKLGLDGHASKGETEVIMVSYPELVHLECLPKTGKLKYPDYGIVDVDAFGCKPSPDFTTRSDPRKAVRNHGIKMVEAAVARLGEVIKVN